MPKSFNIKDAIDWVGQAWHNVSTSTIQNCWNKTGILVQNPRIDVVNEFIDLSETELQSLVNQLSTEHVTIEEYVNLENSVQSSDTLTVEDIVQTIQEPSEDELSEDEPFQEPLPNISPSEALCALDKLVIYLDQNQENYSNDTKSVLRNLRRSINCHVIETRKQSSITQYFHQ